MALPLLDEQLDELCAAFGVPRTPETLDTIERAIDKAAVDASRGHLPSIDTLPSPIARAEARRRFEERGPATGVEIISGTGA